MTCAKPQKLSMYIIYSKPNCSFCTQSKALLTSKDLEYVEIELDQGQIKNSDSNYVSMLEFRAMLPDAKTLPQIFYRHGGAAPCKEYIGGFAELKTYLNK